MKTKSFKIGGKDVECKELTVGQMRQAKKLMQDDEFEAGLLMVKMSTGRADDWLDNQSMSELEQIGTWLGNPTE